MNKLLLTKKVLFKKALFFGFAFFLSFPLTANPYFDGMGGQALMQLAYVGSEALEILKEDRLSDEDLNAYLAPNHIDKELRKSAGCISYKGYLDMNWSRVGSGSLVQVGKSRPVLLTNAHVFLDEKGVFKGGEYNFILDCGDITGDSSEIYINTELLQVYKTKKLFGNYDQNKDDRKDYAFISLKEIPRNGKALILKAVEHSGNFSEKIYLSGVIKDENGNKRQKTLSCNFKNISNYGNSASQANLVSHNCPTTHGTSGSPLVASCEDNYGRKTYCLEALHRSTLKTNEERDGRKKAITFNEAFIKYIEDKVKVLESCHYSKENIYSYAGCLRKY